MVEHTMLFCPAHMALSPSARCLLIQLMSMYNGENNGSLYLSVRDAADRIGAADPHVAVNAFNELQNMGFIVCTGEAFFSQKASSRSRARMWRLTCYPGPGNLGPTMDFLKIEPPPGTRERKRMEAGQKVLKRYRKDHNSGRLPVWDSITDDPLGHLAPENR